MLDIQNITYHIAGRTLFKGANMSLPSGHHAALVGRNGAGKTTLFKIIQNQVQPDQGHVQMPNGATIGTVMQDTPVGSGSPLDFLLESDVEYKELMRAAETETDPHKIAEIHIRLSEIDAYAAPARAAKILKGLGFSDEDQGRPLSSFSGGWRKRVALGAILFLSPDILLLDEPSNHLDLEATIWLTQHLKSYPGTILLISHDKHIINAVVDRIYHLHDQTLTLYMGDYDAFQEKRTLVAMQQQAAHEKQQAHRAHIQQFVDRFRAKSSKARQVQSRLKQLSKMEEIHLAQQDVSIPIDFPEPEKLAPPLVSLENMSVGYDGTVVLEKLNQRIDPEDAIALLGRNGNGKSTFAKAVAGLLEPMRGGRKVYNDFSIGFFHQHQLEMLTPHETAFQHLANVMRTAAPTTIRSFLGRFGFSAEKADVPVQNLSGGEKTRLAFALLAHQKPSLLILDEPTNHLDIEAREALVLGLNAYAGAVILITHDWELLELTANKLWIVDNKRVTPFDGSLEDYQRQVLGVSPDKAKKDKSRAAEIKAQKHKKNAKGSVGGKAKGPAKGKSKGKKS